MTLDDPGQGRPPVLLACLVAVATGLGWATAHPSPGVWWLVLLVVPGWMTAVHLVRRARPRVAAGVGLLVGLAAFLPMLRWLAGIPGGAFAWPALSLVMALYVAGASVVVRRWTASPRVAVVGPLVWTGVEVLRGRWPLGGFGWGDLASAHTSESWMLTVARVLGADGLTLMTALLGGCAWAAVRTGLAVRDDVEVPSGHTVQPTAARLVAVADEVRPLLLATVGVAVLGTLVTADPLPVEGEVDVLVVQGHDGRADGSGTGRTLAIAESHADATVAAVARGGVPDLTVWAESSLDRDPSSERGAALRPAVTRAAAAVGGDLVAGVTQVLDDQRFRRRYVVFDAGGRPTGPVYDKQHPVPFGEYVPLRPLLGSIGPLDRFVTRDQVAGEGPVTLDAGGVRVAPIICFETLFGPLVREAVTADDAGLVVAGTNDTAYGVSDESAQHLAQSRLRAVETGRAVVHASITGSSAIVLPDGAITEQTPLFEVATVRASVPVVTGRTPALTIATPLSWVLLATLAGLVGDAVVRTVAGRRRRRSAAATATTGDGAADTSEEQR